MAYWFPMHLLIIINPVKSIYDHTNKRRLKTSEESNVDSVLDLIFFSGR